MFDGNSSYYFKLMLIAWALIIKRISTIAMSLCFHLLWMTVIGSCLMGQYVDGYMKGKQIIHPSSTCSSFLSTILFNILFDFSAFTGLFMF